MFAYTQMGTIVNLDRFDGVISKEEENNVCLYTDGNHCESGPL